jgi:hypothetical protein
MLRAHRRVDIRSLTAIIVVGIVLSACAPIFQPASLPPERFKGDSGPKLVRVSLLGGGSDIILSHPLLLGDSLVGAAPTPRLAVQVGTHVLHADSTGRLAIPVTDIRRIVSEQSDQSKANRGLALGVIVFLSVAALAIEYGF